MFRHKQLVRLGGMTRRGLAAYCGAGAGVVAAGAAAGFSPVRRSWRRSWRPWRRSWRPVRLDWRRFIPWVPAASAGAAAGAAASCAWASEGASTAGSVKPNAAPRPSRESAFRRDMPSLISSVSRFRGPTGPVCKAGAFSHERRLNDGNREPHPRRKVAERNVVAPATRRESTPRPALDRALSGYKESLSNTAPH